MYFLVIGRAYIFSDAWLGNEAEDEARGVAGAVLPSSRIFEIAPFQ